MRISTTFIQTLLAAVLVLIPLEIGYGFDGPELPIPANTKLSLQLLSPISTATGKKGDKFSCKILTPAEYAGAIAEGHIRDLKRSGKANKESKIDLGFDTVTMPDGRTADLNATVIEVFDVADVKDQGRADNEGTVRNKSSTVKTSVKRAAAGALIGALIGGVVAGGAGAAAGAAIGASIGVTTTLATRGSDLEFKEGTQFTVECNGPTRRSRPPTAPKTSEQPGTPEVGTGAVPDLPLRSYRAYSANRLFSLSVPDNWRETSSSNGASFAPGGGYVNYKGRPSLTHGAIVGTTPSQIKDLQGASEQLVSALLQINSYLHRQGDYDRGMIAGRNAQSISLVGTAEGTNRPEVVTVHITLLSNGNLFYLITVVPQQDAEGYQEAFDAVLRSIQFSN